MFDMQKIGRILSELRKKHNMTQMELADRMGISFQAVSNWERGTSMPDISKLPELAALFGVSIDELLGQEAPLVRSVAENNTAKYVQTHPEAVQELTDAAPILTAQQMDEAVQNLEQVQKSLAEIEHLLPFLDSETQNLLAQKAAAEQRWQDVERLAPFLSRAILDEIADVLPLHKFESLAPFLSGERLREIVLKRYEQEGCLKNVEAFLPFLDGKTEEELVQKAIASKNWHDVESMAPFLNRELMNKAVEAMVQADGLRAVDGLAPFLSQDLLREILQKYL